MNRVCGICGKTLLPRQGKYCSRECTRRGPKNAVKLADINIDASNKLLARAW